MNCKVSFWSSKCKSGRKVNSLVIHILVMVLLGAYFSSVEAHFWEKPGCHKVGHSRRIRIPNCVQFDMATNACRGYCLSYAVPSKQELLMLNPNQGITSVGQCCSMMETEDVSVRVMCMDGPRTFTFKSAKTCGCYHCEKE